MEAELLHVEVTDSDWVLAAQLNDERCKEIHQSLSREPVDESDRRVHNEYALKDNRVYRKTTQGLRWVVPKSSRRGILMFYYDAAGHFAVEKTLESVAKRYWFPSMRHYIKNYIAACLPCTYNKKPSGKVPGNLYSIDKCNVPFDTLHLDHLGPFVKSKRGNSYLIVVVDAFTKFVFLKAIPNTKTAPVIKFLNEIIESFGVPRRVICDRGTAFTSQSFTSFCSDLGVKRVLCATATPRANGQVERMNRVILSALSTSVDNDQNWDKELCKVKWGINSSVSSVTGKSPYEVFFGYQLRGVNDAFLTSEISETQPVNHMEIRSEVVKRIQEQQSTKKKYYDRRHAKEKTFAVGQQVLVHRVKCSNDGQSKKLEPRYQGPFTVTAVLTNDRYVVEDLKGTERCRKPYKGICPSDKLKAFNTVVSSSESETDAENSHA
ncbi:hypothetical protein NQ315_013570 [Exocentrus adspersus]|uniref:RNA-directed DNA polymerase n=1 Tax=Exocentrus adspersus TaxID=1586481 RepID=A0AAV8V736_9CUCU|nr:hypothetical protein NQ315_013570 [Exocentrus adspersus]